MRTALLILITIFGVLVTTLVIKNAKMEQEEEENRIFRDSLKAHVYCDDECFNCKNKCWCTFSTWRNK